MIDPHMIDPHIVTTFFAAILFTAAYFLVLRKYLSKKKRFERIGTYIFAFIGCWVIVAIAYMKIVNSMSCHIVLVEKDSNGKVIHKVKAVYEYEYTTSQGQKVFLEREKWYIDNATDEELVLYDTDYSDKRYSHETRTTTIPIEPKTFTKSPFAIDFCFKAPPPYVLEEDKKSVSKKATRWTLTLKSDSLLNKTSPF